MKEVITAYPLERGRPSSVSVDTRTPFMLHNEAVEQKTLLVGSVAERKISLIERQLDHKYIENWQAFRRIGLPVVPTLRKTSQETMLLTDVKADGSEVYGKNLLFVLQQDLPRERPRPDRDTTFLRLMRRWNFRGIEKQAMRYVERANEHGLWLPHDDPFELVVHPDKSWDLITLDLTYGGLDTPTDGLVTDVALWGNSPEKRNYAKTRHFLDILKTIPDALNGEKLVY